MIGNVFTRVLSSSLMVRVDGGMYGLVLVMVLTVVTTIAVRAFPMDLVIKAVFPKKKTSYRYYFQ